jgi:hypothetical protein
MQATTDYKALMNAIKAEFTKKDTSFNRFCLEIKVDPSNAKKALKGEWKGDKANELLTLISQATNIEIEVQS